MGFEPTAMSADEKGKNPAMLFDLTDKPVWVAGQHGMVGGAVMRRLEREPCALLRDPGRAAVDFRRQSEVEDWIASHSPRIIILTAGRVHLTRSKRSHA
jgi:GDP-L-fucose synthase